MNKSSVPEMLPRERLTRKAREAISKYTIVRCEGRPYHYFMVDAVLEAERMRRADLYGWLEKRGYCWLPHAGIWKKKPVK